MTQRGDRSKDWQNRGFAANSATCHLCRGPSHGPPRVASDAVTANSIALSQTPQNQFLLRFLTLQNPRPAAFTPAFVFYSGSQNLSFSFFCNSIWKQILSYKVKTKICISDISTNPRSLLKQTCDIGKPCIRTFCNSFTCFFFHLMFLFYYYSIIYFL